MSRVRVAVVGTGYFSQYHYDAWQRMDDVEIAGIAFGSNRRRAELFAERCGVSQTFDKVSRMLDEVQPDLVDIVSPPETHLAIISEVAARRIPVISQKPLAPNLAEARGVGEAAAKTGTLVVVHENWRFKPWFREIRRLISDGVIGEVYNLSFRLRPGDGQGPQAYMQRQPYFRDMPRFLIHETGIHLIDVFRFIIGEIEAVSARLRQINPVIAGEDAGYVVIDFASGAAGLLDGNRLPDFESEDTRLTMGEMLIEGSAGDIRLDGAARIWVRPRRGLPRLHEYVWHDRGYGGDCVYALQRHVVDHLLIGTPVENAVAEYLRNPLVEDAIYRSDAERRRVVVDVHAVEA
jgi:predicted dehydrogenase